MSVVLFVSFALNLWQRGVVGCVFEGNQRRRVFADDCIRVVFGLQVVIQVEVVVA